VDPYTYLQYMRWDIPRAAQSSTALASNALVVRFVLVADHGKDLHHTADVTDINEFDEADQFLLVKGPDEIASLR